MKRLILISLVIIGITSCDTKVEDGDLVYLSQREDRHLSLRPDNYFKCSDEEKEPLVFVEIDNKTFSLKTEDGLNVYYKNYFLMVGNEKPDIFTKEKIDNKL